jgi:hypothetical protein
VFFYKNKHQASGKKEIMDAIISQLQSLDQKQNKKFSELYELYLETKILFIHLEEKLHLVQSILQTDEKSCSDKDKLLLCEFLLSSNATTANDLIDELFPEIEKTDEKEKSSTPYEKVFVYEFRKYLDATKELKSIHSFIDLLNYLTWDYEHIRSSVKESKAFQEAIIAAIRSFDEKLILVKDDQLISKYGQAITRLESIYSFEV